MSKVSIDDLRFKSEFGLNCGQYQQGYRIVFFYPDNTYSVETFSGSIEGFMMDFVEIEPIMDEDDIPPFISIDNILDRYLLDVEDIVAVAIYKTDGTCIERKERESVKHNIK